MSGHSEDPCGRNHPGDHEGLRFRYPLKKEPADAFEASAGFSVSGSCGARRPFGKSVAEITGAPAIGDAVFVFFNRDTVSNDCLACCGSAADYNPSAVKKCFASAIEWSGQGKAAVCNPLSVSGTAWAGKVSVRLFRCRADPTTLWRDPGGSALPSW